MTFNDILLFIYINESSKFNGNCIKFHIQKFNFVSFENLFHLIAFLFN